MRTYNLVRGEEETDAKLIERCNERIRSAQEWKERGGVLIINHRHLVDAITFGELDYRAKRDGWEGVLYDVQVKLARLLNELQRDDIPLVVTESAEIFKNPDSRSHRAFMYFIEKCNSRILIAKNVLENRLEEIMAYVDLAVNPKPGYEEFREEASSIASRVMAGRMVGASQQEVAAKNDALEQFRTKYSSMFDHLSAL